MLNNEQNEQQEQHALHVLPPDKRDFNFFSFFGIVHPEDLPDEYIVDGLEVENQGSTDACSSYSTTKASEAQEGVKLSPEYQFAKTKQLLGKYEDWGADNRTACKSLVKWGSIKQQHSPFRFGRESRDQIADWNNWSLLLDVQAVEHSKKSFYSVHGLWDTFDDIRCALWHSRDDRACVVSGAGWRNSWTYTSNGIIPETYEDNFFGHAFCIKGFCTISDEDDILVRDGKMTMEEALNRYRDGTSR